MIYLMLVAVDNIIYHCYCKVGVCSELSAYEICIILSSYCIFMFVHGRHWLKKKCSSSFDVDIYKQIEQ